MSISEVSSASDIQMDYMKLLVSQLQNQNPLDPMDNSDMASQLAQFSQLSQLEGMNSSFSEVLSTTNKNYANSLIDKTVTFYMENETSGELETKSGVVESVYYDVENQENLLGIKCGDDERYTLGLDGVVLVENQ